MSIKKVICGCKNRRTFPVLFKQRFPSQYHTSRCVPGPGCTLLLSVREHERPEVKGRLRALSQTCSKSGRRECREVETRRVRGSAGDSDLTSKQLILQFFIVFRLHSYKESGWMSLILSLQLFLASTVFFKKGVCFFEELDSFYLFV